MLHRHVHILSKTKTKADLKYWSLNLQSLLIWHRLLIKLFTSIHLWNLTFTFPLFYWHICSRPAPSVLSADSAKHPSADICTISASWHLSDNSGFQEQMHYPLPCDVQVSAQMLHEFLMHCYLLFSFYKTCW